MKKILFAAMMVAANARLNAQDPQSTANPTKLDHNIQTPNAASISRYGNIPVSLFTGVPNINIPLYDISVGKHSFPISISYHASGIKNDDISGDVGLGFNLNSTFSIVRTLRGKPDEDGYVGHNDAAMIPSPVSTHSSPSSIPIFKGSAENIFDTQPDEFNFNIDGLSGKFVMSPNKIIVIPDQDIKVEYTPEFNFIITDPKGVKYFFSDASIASPMMSCNEDPGLPEYKSTWYISKIVYPDTKDSLTFNYTIEVIALSNSSESKTYEYPTGFAAYPVKERNCFNSNSTVEKKIKRIDFPTGKIDFYYNMQKKEVDGKALSYFEVKDIQGNSIQKANFSYSYYNAGSSNNLAKKLKLDSLYTSFPDGSIAGRHKFDYNGTNIAAYQSKSKDHWGYNNGSSNLSLIPANTFQVPDASGVLFWVPGGDREVHPDLAGIGVLNKITYPTGGYTAFEFENNTYGAECGGHVYDSVFTTVNFEKSASCQYNTNTQMQTSEGVFTPGFTQLTDVTVTSNQFACTGTTFHFTLKDLTANVIVASGLTSVPSVQLLAGHNYKLAAEADCRDAEANMLNCHQFVNVKVPYRIFSGIVEMNHFAGGLRIKKITDYDQYSNVNNVRTYSYQMPNDPGRSSGILMYKPVYHYMHRYIKDFGPGPSGIVVYVPDARPVFCQTFTSEANNTTQNDKYSIGYQYVKETIGLQGEGGSTLSHFSTGFGNCGSGNFPFPPMSSRYYRDGLLLDEAKYNSSNTMVKSKSNTYGSVIGDRIEGWKASCETNSFISNGQAYGYYPEYIASWYWYTREKVRLLSTEVKDIFSPPNQMVYTTTYYFLNDESLYPYKTEMQNSNGSTSSQYNWRVCDFNIVPSSGLSGATKALRFMKDNHQNDYTVEAIDKVNGLTQASIITEFMVTGFGPDEKTNPAKIYKLNNASPLNNYAEVQRNITSNNTTLAKDSRMTLELTSSDYNEKGKPSTLTGLEGAKIVLVYGYNKNYEVAKIMNASLSDINAYLAANPTVQGAINNPVSDQVLRDAIQNIRNAFPQAMITGYTYKPLIGMTSQTDVNNNVTFYEYDAMGRLARIKDKNGNILKQNSYQYQVTE